MVTHVVTEVGLFVETRVTEMTTQRAPLLFHGAARGRFVRNFSMGTVVNANVLLQLLVTVELKFAS